MKKLILAFLVLGFISCSDEDRTCVDDLIDDFKTEACRGSGDVTIWEFQGREVYCLNYGTCYADRGVDIYEEDCTLLCNLFGLNGNTVCDGVEWQEAVFQSTEYTH